MDVLDGCSAIEVEASLVLGHEEGAEETHVSAFALEFLTGPAGPGRELLQLPPSASGSRELDCVVRQCFDAGTLGSRRPTTQSWKSLVIHPLSRVASSVRERIPSLA
jgi:hypothetical protein